ncbi:uncharacterized protein LOC133197534 [Saccostrea echinata]|uniref:uncharacterized protein LOC133197534 n=1 Tax=Saccostrea echinata TaxID=191078 RepID=UPI002A80E7A3|nr:uncharacterized protein LOC133197534 [Saccostrea echinata]
MDNATNSTHRHGGDLCSLTVCQEILQQLEAVLSECNKPQACDLIEYFLYLHERYKLSKSDQTCLDNISKYSGSEGICLKSTESRTNKVLKDEEDETLSSTPTQSSDIDTERFKCPHCHAQFQSKLKVHIHLALKHQGCLKKSRKTRHDTEFSIGAACPLCGKMFSNYKKLKTHKKMCLPSLMQRKPKVKALYQRLYKKSYQHRLVHPGGTQMHLSLYTCTCGQNFKWKSIYFHHKRKCKSGTRTKASGLREKVKYSCYPQLEGSGAQTKEEVRDSLTTYSLEEKSGESLYSEDTLLSKKNDVLSKIESFSLPSNDHKEVEEHSSMKDQNADVLKMESVALNTIDISHPYPKCKQERLDDHELESEGMFFKGSQSKTLIKTDGSRSLGECDGKMVSVKSEPTDNYFQVEGLNLSKECLKESDNSMKEEAPSMMDNREPQDKLSERSATQMVEEVSDCETFYMEDEVAIVDLSNMNVTVSSSDVQKEKFAIASSELDNGDYVQQNSGKGHQYVLNLSNKPDSREERLEMQKHYENTCGVKQINQTCSQCPNCLAFYKTSQELIFHIQNSQCRFVFDSANTKAIHHRLCRICNLTLTSYPAFALHLQERHGLQGINNMKENSQMKPCKICGQKFLSEAYLREHVQGKHSSVRRYACTCGKTFKWRSSFSGHRRNCSGTISCINKPYPTTMCRYTRKRQGLFNANLPPSAMPRIDKEAPVQPEKIENGFGMGKIPGVHTILNDLKEKFSKPITADTVTNLKAKGASTLLPRAHSEVVPLKLGSKAPTNSLKTDLNSPATQKIIESLKQRANFKWPCNKNISKSTSKSDPQITQHSSSDLRKSIVVSSASTKIDSGSQKQSLPTKSTAQTEGSIFLQNSGSPYGMVFPVGDSAANLTQYLQYQNSFGFSPLNMQQLYHQMSASLSKILSSQNMKTNLNENSFNRSANGTSENLPVQYVNKSQNKPLNIENRNYTGSQMEKKSEQSSASFVGNSFTCPTCKMSFLEKVSMEMHSLKCKNRSMSIYTCSICGMKLRGKASLREHTLGKHSATRYSCSCGMKFKWRSSLGSHQKHCNEYMKKFY